MHLKIFVILGLAIASCHARALHVIQNESVPVKLETTPESSNVGAASEETPRPKVYMRVINSAKERKRRSLPEYHSRVVPHYRESIRVRAPEAVHPVPVHLQLHDAVEGSLHHSRGHSGFKPLALPGGDEDLEDQPSFFEVDEDDAGHEDLGHHVIGEDEHHPAGHHVDHHHADEHHAGEHHVDHFADDPHADDPHADDHSDHVSENDEDEEHEDHEDEEHDDEEDVEQEEEEEEQEHDDDEHEDEEHEDDEHEDEEHEDDEEEEEEDK